MGCSCTRVHTHTHIHTHACTTMCGYICRKDEAVPPKSLCSGLRRNQPTSRAVHTYFSQGPGFCLWSEMCWPRRSRCCRQMAGESPGNQRVIKGPLAAMQAKLASPASLFATSSFPQGSPWTEGTLALKRKKVKLGWATRELTCMALAPSKLAQECQFSSACQTHLVKHWVCHPANLCLSSSMAS